MEMQYLSEARQEQLKPIMEVWKEHRRELAEADVMPIGDRPSGRSFTGFYISKGGEPKYMLVFREVTRERKGKFAVPGMDALDNCDDRFKVLAGNAKVEITGAEGEICVEFSKPRAYAFIKIDK